MLTSGTASPPFISDLVENCKLICPASITALNKSLLITKEPTAESQELNILPSIEITGNESAKMLGKCIKNPSLSTIFNTESSPRIDNFASKSWIRGIPLKFALLNSFKVTSANIFPESFPAISAIISPLGCNRLSQVLTDVLFSTGSSKKDTKVSNFAPSKKKLKSCHRAPIFFSKMMFIGSNFLLGSVISKFCKRTPQSSPGEYQPVKLVLNSRRLVIFLFSDSLLVLMYPFTSVLPPGFTSNHISPSTLTLS